MWKTRSLPIAFMMLTTFAGGCTAPEEAVDSSSNEVKALDRAQVLQDFDAMVAAVRENYGPLDYKKKKFGFDLGARAAFYRKQLETLTTETDFMQTFRLFLAELQDAHVSLRIPIEADGVLAYRLPFLATPVEDVAVVSRVISDDGRQTVERGDVVLSIDGKLTAELMKQFSPFSGAGRPETLRHFTAENLSLRPSYFPAALKPDPNAKFAQVLVRKSSGKEVTVALPWTKIQRERTNVVGNKPAAGSAWGLSQDVADVIQGDVAGHGAPDAFFMTPQVGAAYGISNKNVVAPGAAALKAVGLDGATPKDLDALKLPALRYAFKGKQILLVRIPNYGVVFPNRRLATSDWFCALLSEQKSQVDALVIDQTHNPGGDITYSTTFLRPFVKPGTKAVNVVQYWRADRRALGFLDGLVQEFKTQSPQESAEFQRQFDIVEAANDKGELLSPPIPIGPDSYIEPNPICTWDKPMTMLIDELSGSCGDIVPMLTKRNGLGRIFGATTGGWGGSVEQVLTLPASNGTLSLTRGLWMPFRPDGKYTEADLVENVGVKPDVEYSHSLADFRAGYVGYFGAFSTEAIRGL